jgi:hypothetical protein
MTIDLGQNSPASGDFVEGQTDLDVKASSRERARRGLTATSTR